MKSSRALLLIATVVLALSASACGRYLEASAAVVDGKAISMDELDLRVNASLPKTPAPSSQQVLEAQRKELGQMIQDQIIANEARRRGITVASGEVEERYQSIRAQFQSEEEFASALAQQGVSVDNVRSRIRLRLIVEAIQKDLAESIKILDVDVRNIFGRGERFQQAEVQHILFGVQSPDQDAAALKEAKAVLGQLRAGGNFAALAKKHSDDPGSKDKGGSLGAITRGQTVPEFERSAFSLKPNQVSEPVRSQFGYHLIKTLKVTRKNLKQATPEIKEQIRSERGQAAFGEFLSKRVVKADVRVNPRFGVFDAESLEITPSKFYTPASRPPVPEGIPGLQVPPPEPEAVPDGSTVTVPGG